jgi:hypothetical protein
LGKYDNRRGVYFLNEFPAIYPLLEKVSAYIGDHSSIGYDFLYYDRPLYFLEKKEKAPLQECGRAVEDIKELEGWLKEDGKEFSEKRRELYCYAFGGSG